MKSWEWIDYDVRWCMIQCCTKVKISFLKNILLFFSCLEERIHIPHSTFCAHDLRSNFISLFANGDYLIFLSISRKEKIRFRHQQQSCWVDLFNEIYVVLGLCKKKLGFRVFSNVDCIKWQRCTEYRIWFNAILFVFEAEWIRCKRKRH